MIYTKVLSAFLSQYTTWYTYFIYCNNIFNIKNINSSYKYFINLVKMCIDFFKTS